MKRPKEPASSNADWIRLYIWRAHKMLSAALAGRAGGSCGWLPLPSSDKERERYEGLKRAAEQLREMVDRGIDTADATDAMLQFGMLMELANDWNRRRTQPHWAIFRAADVVKRQNRKKANDKRKSNAESELIAKFAAWQRKARGVLWKDGKPLSARRRAELFAKFSTYKPRSLQRRRLFALADAGRLPDPPSV